MTSSKISTALPPSSPLAEHGRKASSVAMRAAAAHHRFDDDDRQVGRMLADGGPGVVDVVVAAEDEGERHVERRRAREVEDAAMVAALHHQHLGALGVGARGRDGEQVALGAGIREAHLVDRREAVADQRRQLRLDQVGAAQRDAAFQRAADRLHDGGVGMAVEAGRELAQEVAVLVPVGIPHARALALGDGQREGREVDDRARVAARHHLRRLDLAGGALRVAGGIVGTGLGQRRFEIGVQSTGCFHRVLRQAPVGASRAPEIASGRYRSHPGPALSMIEPVRPDRAIRR
jgi:hypothetical protein